MKEFYYTPQRESYDAIVVGSGISGGWVCKELCQKGLKVLLLERGRMVNHVQDYSTMNKDPWDFEFLGQPSQDDIKKQFKQHRTGYTTNKAWSHWFVDDEAHPYNEIKRFDWIRGYQLGGRSIVWGRHSYRLSDLDFKANVKEGIGVDWPIRYKDLAPWYDYVEKFAGISGEKLGLSQLPDSRFLPPMELNCVEQHLREKIQKKYKNRIVTMGRIAHLTGGNFPGRGLCQYRNRCMRGCPFGAYFCSLSTTLPEAEKTDNLTLRPHSIVHQIVYDKNSKKAKGVKVIDANTNKNYEYSAKLVFLCAGAMASTGILLNSKSDRFPDGMGNDCGELGHNIMDHHFKAGAYAQFDGYQDQFYEGRRPGGIYFPRFRNLDKDSAQKSFLRGYGYQGGASRKDWKANIKELSHGKAFKTAILKPGGWQIGLMGFGEVLPNHRNRLFLDYDKTDKWGLPTLSFDASFGENELAMRKDMITQAMEMLDMAGFKNIHKMDDIGAPGLGIHEMGTARMGKDPKTSVLNKYNQIHDVKNVFVTDGSCMSSSACQNPSLTYMALSARAAGFAVSELKKRNL